MEEEEQITPRKTNTLSIAEMTTDKTGLYHCSYQRGGRWSQFSDPLQLVMTGAYDKPSLSSVAGTVAAPGENAKLQCFSRINYDVFILTKDGDHITQDQSSAPQDRGHQTIFLLSPVSSTQAGTYRCYGAFRDNAYVWSQPSDPLQLQVEGNLPPPRISALPGSTVPPKSHVTLLCQGPGQAEGYKISKVGSPEPTDEEEQITPRKTNTLSIAEITTDKTGQYHCSYQRGGHWSQFSDPLNLVMTGAFSKPSLSSLAGTVAAPGENAKLQCFSKINHDVFILTKDGDHITQNQSSAPQDRGHQTIFLLSPVSSTQAGTYRCYGAFRDNPYVWSQPSDPLQLQVEGNLPPPRITALPGFTVPCKGHVTLLCQGPGQAEGFEISKVGSPEPTDKEEQITPRKTNTLNITEITTDKTGLYHCSYQREGRWSQFSDPLQLVMTGAYEKPSLSSVAGTVAAPGENAKLQCFSKINYEVFILTKDGDHITQNQSSTPQDRGHQTIFLLSPVSSTQAGTYRCYGAFRDNPYVWSHPSDPLQLQVEGSSTQHRRSTDAARKERQPEAAGRANGQVSEAADPQEVTYSQVTCRVPHQGTAGAPSREPRQTQSSEYVTLAFR
ncbi:hypothetical protein JEQ12_005731 [Ovis aries]|uniref:Ig-like domain-containing protein n=1 Tax=Ovis aries TaxID=9940 RepID=A0A835ZTH5_SHEEP|nr:hypothetical protein JEQ12_005731 [Ovis aries]